MPVAQHLADLMEPAPRRSSSVATPWRKRWVLVSGIPARSQAWRTTARTRSSTTVPPGRPSPQEHLHPSDSLSEVKATYYRVGDGPTGSGTSLTIAADGTHAIEYWSVDNPGNEEPRRSVVVKVDTQRPTISGEQTPEANTNGWNNRGDLGELQDQTERCRLLQLLGEGARVVVGGADRVG
ncbi:MAG: hypothetical protein M3P85_14835 [Actinomycetota bacterium]|nr:hypothetical protein [Actinomycetota bacterium]